MEAIAEISHPVRVLSEELVLVDWGPMTLTISAWDKGAARPVIAAKAAHQALACLKTLSEFQSFLKRPTADLPARPKLPEVVKGAFRAARSISKKLTSLAAVAGATADHVADAAVKLGADKVIVNNGGDIALRLDSAESAVVGVKPQGADKLIGRLHLNHEHGIGGIASSGWGGRSHSTGVADLVTVWAQNAGRADAAATLIAGKTVALGKNVKRTRCCELDPLSDLGNMPVTEKVGRLTSAQRRQALDQGAVIAEKMYLQGLIRGCLLCVQGDTILLDPDDIMTQVQLCKSSARK